MDEHPRLSSIKLSIVLTLIGSTLFGTVGGAIMGGLAGYTIAVYQAPDPLILNAPQTANQPQSSLATRQTPEALPYLIHENEALVNAVERVKPATVSVVNQSNFGETTGSGVIIDKAGYIVTNHHVIAGLSNLEVVLSDGSQVPAQVVGSTVDYDLPSSKSLQTMSRLWLYLATHRP